MCGRPGPPWARRPVRSQTPPAGSRQIEQLTRQAHDGAAVELLKAAARQWLAVGQGELEPAKVQTQLLRSMLVAVPGWAIIVQLLMREGKGRSHAIAGNIDSPHGC